MAYSGEDVSDQQWSQAPEGTELQYYLDYARAIQEQESYIYQQQTSRRYSNVSGGYPFEGIPENAEVTFSTGGQVLPEWGGSGERLADAAVLSWKIGKPQTAGSQTSDLGQSMRTGSEIELKDFVKLRGERHLEGLHKASAQGDRAGIMQFMKHHGPGAHIDELDSNGCTPLMYASMADSTLAIEMLLNFSAKREQVDSEGRTAVHYAAFFGKHKALKFLIEAAADWTPRDVYGRTPLHWTSANRSTKCLAVLLKHAGVVMGDINPRDNEDMTPLHCAAQFGRAKHITLLNQADADVTAVDIEGKTALHWTINNPDSSSILALMEAYPPLISKKDVHRNTVLHLAARAGTTHIADTFLKLSGIEVDATNDQQKTALHLACQNNHSETAQLLLTYSALNSIVDSEGLTALHYAVENSAMSALQAFAQVPDLTHLPNNEGITPLMMAAEKGLEEPVEILIRNRAVAKSVDTVDINGRSALHLAAYSGSAACVSSLVSCGANPNLLDSFQQTPLFLATEHGHGDCIQVLITGGCQPDSRDIEGQAPLHKALLHDQMSSIQALVTSGADLNILDSNGNTPLHMAAYSGNDTVTSTLLENGANPNIQDVNGWNPVHYSAMEGNIECLATLLAYKAYANFMDISDEGYTPLDYASMNGHVDCVDVLVQAGGLASDGIRTMAAVTIQTAYRGQRSRLILADLKKKEKAVTTIAAPVRGYLQRKKYQELKKRHYSAILIQANIRGFLQRLKFKVQLSQHRAQERHYQLMVDYGETVASDHAAATLRTFTKDELVPTSENLMSLEVSNQQREREQKLRLEKALQMREVYLEKQKKWREFREAEHKRRTDKAKKEELDRYADIVAKSKARRDYTATMFYQTHTVRSYNEAAIVLQRAYRRMKLHRSFLGEKVLREAEWKRKKEDRAARKIQHAWRVYHQYRLFQALNFKKIRTSPVISTRRHSRRKLNELHSYEKGISITGNPRRRVHQTEQSGFKLFRPTTRDLLFKPQTRSTLTPNRPATDQSLGYLFVTQASIRGRGNNEVDKNQHIEPKTSRFPSSLEVKNTKRVKRGSLLPELFVRTNLPTADYRSTSSSKTKLCLPDIVGV